MRKEEEGEEKGDGNRGKRWRMRKGEGWTERAREEGGKGGKVVESK